MSNTNKAADEQVKSQVIDLEKGLDDATAAEIDALMRKYDAESNVRVWTGKPKLLVGAVNVIFSLYCIWSTLFSTSDLQVRLPMFLGCIVIMGFLTYPIKKGDMRPNRIPIYDIAIMAAGAFSFFWYSFNYMDMMRANITSASKLTTFHIAIGIIGILVMAELCRRSVGIPILVVVSVLMIYTFWSGQALPRVIHTMFYGTSGVLATPVQVCAKFIGVFIIFGAFLERTGISNFFIALANSAVGWASGGPAKVAVISSALCGMVSGSSVGNTVTTGSITIPMMKDTGYKPQFAAAVEASASTGGQIMPPIMGAAAFLMAEYMGIPYIQVAMYAILPAVLYFSGIFMTVHLEAKKLGLKGIPRDQLPKFSQLVKRIYLLAPLVILVVLVSANIRSLQFSATLAIVIAILVGIPDMLVNAKKNEAGLPGTTVSRFVKKLLTTIWEALEAGGRGVITVAVACSMAGMIAGCITVTGLASKLVSAVVNLSAMIPNPTLSMLFALFLTMLCCIVLGMGVPTTANYCIMASTCAPILITLGVPRVAAHFFVFYFGIVADITPPVALAAFAGAAIAKCDPMKAGFNATRLAIAAFLVPYIFAINPTMLLMDKGIVSAVTIIVTSFLGLFGIASALNGHLFAKINPLFRVGLAAGGLCMMIPGTFTDIIGIALVVGIVIIQRMLGKKEAAKA